jgi:superfamily II DNA or RNA helicase
MALLLQRQLGDGNRSWTLQARPAIRGARGNWVRQGAAWTDLDSVWSQRRPLPEQRDALLALHRHLDSATGQYRYWRSPTAWLTVDDVPGAMVWSALDAVRRAGIPLLDAEAKNAPVRVLADPVSVVVDLRDDEGNLTVTPSVLVDGLRLAPGEIGLLGSPGPAGVFWREEDTGTLCLARFDEPVDARAESLLTMPRSLRVDPSSMPTFWSQYAPRLAGVLPLVSLDGSVETPAPPSPGLHVTVTRREGHTVRVAWSWRYRDERGQGPDPVPVGPVDRGSQPWRDVVAEGAILDRTRQAITAITGTEGPLPGRPDTGADLDTARRLRAALVDPLADPLAGGLVPSGDPGAGSGLTGWDTVALVERVLPVLRSTDDVEVEVIGELPEYREATDPLRVVVRTEDGAAGDLDADRDWFDLAVEVDVDGHPVPMAELLRALALDEDRLLLDDGLWVRLDTPALDALRTLVAEARALSDDPRAPLRVSRYDVDAWQELAELGVIVRQSRAWTEAVRRLSTLTDPPIDLEPPAMLRATLRPYQQAGYGWLRTLTEQGLGGILADDMGLGKTLQALAFVAWWRGTPQGKAGPVLVVAPTSVVGTWASEAARFTPDLTVRTVTATGARRAESLVEVADGADLVVTSYSLFRLEFDGYQELTWSTLVLDEAQMVKNHKSRGYGCVRALDVPVKLAVTGTPLENSLTELWALLGLVAPGLFPNQKRFTEHYQLPVERHHDADRLAELRRRIRPVMLRRTKEQVAVDLPPRLEHVVDVDLVPRHRALYDRVLTRERQKILGLLDDFDGNRFEIFRSLMLLRRLALDPSLVDDAHRGVPASKLDHVMTMLEEIVADGHRVLVFSQFTGLLGRVRERLDARGTAYSYLDGTTRRRAQVIERFRSGTIPVFLISLKAGGVGLTLTEADYVILLDPWWNPAVEAQAVDRTHRIGQTRQVMVYRLVAAGTIEDKVMALKAAKARLFDSVLGGDDLTDARFTAADVRALLG